MITINAETDLSNETATTSTTRHGPIPSQACFADARLLARANGLPLVRILALTLSSSPLYKKSSMASSQAGKAPDLPDNRPLNLERWEELMSSVSYFRFLIDDYPLLIDVLTGHSSRVAERLRDSIMLGELLARDITDWTNEDIPETEALRLQKMLNLSNDPVAAWWYSRLEEGIFVLSGAGGTERYEWKSDDITWVSVADMVADYQAFARSHGYRGDEQRIKNKLARYMPSGFDTKVRTGDSVDGKRKTRMYPIPPLAEARRLFTEATGYSVTTQNE